MNRQKEKEKQRKLECIDSKCPYVEQRCIVFHGLSCIRLDGDKIPVQRIANDTKSSPAQRTNGMKPYFIIDEWAMQDGRD